MAAVLEAMWIVDTGNEDLGGTRSNAGDGPDALDTCIILADGLKLLDDDVHLGGGCIELSEFVIQFAFPEFVEGAVRDWFTE